MLDCDNEEIKTVFLRQKKSLKPSMERCMHTQILINSLFCHNGMIYKVWLEYIIYL